jgi:chromosome segregation ATPase
MLRKGLYAAIRRNLERPPLFVPEDFRIDLSEGHDSVVVMIRYLCGDQQFLSATVPQERSEVPNRTTPDFRIHLDFLPGELTERGTAVVYGAENLLKQIKGWVDRLTKDYEQDPLYRTIKAQEAQLSEVEEQLAKLPEDLPTLDQVEKLTTWMTEIEQQLKSQIEALEIDSKEKEKRIAALEAEFALLRERAKTTPVKRLLRALVGRVYRVASDPRLPQLVENGAKIAGLLTGGSDTGQ